MISSSSCLPRWATRRRPERKTFGGRLARIAAALGHPFMPWQRQVADVFGEVDEFGDPYYRELILTVPRQCGKTDLALCAEIDRAIMWGPRRRISYTAQTGKDAREKVLDDQWPLVEASRLVKTCRQPRRTNGSEAIRFKNGSGIYVVPSTEGAGHGKTLSLGIIDEAWDDADNRREAAMGPAMLTLANAQLVVTSTAGTDKSLYWRSKIDLGRVAAENDEGGGICFFEWSAPDDADPEDESVWWSCMPALGHSIGIRAVRHAKQSTPTIDEFRRAYLNQWTSVETRVIPAGVWANVSHPNVKPEGVAVVAVDCTPERDRASIVIADQDARCELVVHEPGSGWLPARAVEYARRYGATVVYDSHGPAGVFAQEIKGVPLVDCSGRAYAQACGALFAAIADQKLQVRQSGPMDNAVAAVQKRSSGDLYVWDRKKVTSDISPFVALTLAVYGIEHRPAPVRLVSLED